MREFKFNFCMPREYLDKGETKFALCRSGEKMEVKSLLEIQKLADNSKPKDAQPWLQVFDNGYRVTHDNLNWKDWTGFTFIDIDSKHFYKFAHPFDVEKLLNCIISEAPYLFCYNYYCCHLTNSKLGFRIFWYWNCEKTEENFIKCCILTEQYTRQLFYSFGEQAKEIIDYKVNGFKVLDSCSKSIFQGSYVTNNHIYFSEFIDNDSFGACNLEDISIEQIYQTNNTIKICGDFKQGEHAEYIKTIEIDKSSLRYYPHSHRRCIYEALIVLFKTKENVDKEWTNIAKMLPEDDGLGGGHSHEFYLAEPDKNRWFERFNKEIIHPLDWLSNFGYEYEDESEYVYYKHFRKSWKNHCHNCVVDLYIAEKKDDYFNENHIKFDDLSKEEQKTLLDKWDSEINGHTIFEKVFENNIKDASRKNAYELYKSRYYDTRWKASDFKYLCNGYHIAKDIVTYKMYADFYYRDENNLPIIKYDILEDEIKVLGYWPETGKTQYHPFKYGNEYTHWKNNDTFSNACSKTDMLEAINKYVPRWHNYHTIKDYLNSLDLSLANEELLETWAIRYFNADDTLLTREICKKWFVAAVKKIFVEIPSSFAYQHMLFLQGPTGCGKTFFLVTMFTINGLNYILNKIDPNGKDNEIGPLIAKNWLIQFGESENLKKVSVNAAKEFMDRVNLGMKYQKKYENEQTTIYPRIMVCRTSNDDVLFNDVSINDGDRRNYLIVCKTGINSCDKKLKETIEKEKDILWATAMKLYLDDPNADLEISNEAFSQLAALQEDYKLIKKSDVQEIFDEIFNRDYIVNDKCHVKDEYTFRELLKRSDVGLKYEHSSIPGEETTEFLSLSDGRIYDKVDKVNTLPVRWVNQYVQDKQGINFLKVFKDLCKSKGLIVKPCRYNDKLVKCWTWEL